MIGFRGASRYVHPDFRECFALECRAVRKVRDEMGLTNCWIMIPFAALCTLLGNLTLSTLFLIPIMVPLFVAWFFYMIRFYLVPWLLGYSVMGMLSFPLESEIARAIYQLAD